MRGETTWYAVRHVLRNRPRYEERITLWDAPGFEAAHELARAEAEEHATFLHDGVLLDLFQIYWLFDEPAIRGNCPSAPGAPVVAAPQGAEVFSLIRESELEPADYLDTFFDTGFELESRRVRIFGEEVGSDSPADDDASGNIIRGGGAGKGDSLSGEEARAVSDYEAGLSYDKSAVTKARKKLTGQEKRAYTRRSRAKKDRRR